MSWEVGDGDQRRLTEGGFNLLARLAPRGCELEDGHTGVVEDGWREKEEEDGKKVWD